MVLLPIVGRELRVSARRRGAYWTRFGTALTGVLVGGFLWLVMRHEPDRAIGQSLFVVLSVIVYAQTLLVGCFTAADSLSEEKREGTLGLLFLTDLKGYDVVLGKLAASSCSAFYGMMAIFPILGLPLLMGGVAVGEFGRVVLVALNNMFLSLAMGIFCSSVSRDEGRARGATFLLLAGLTGGLPLAVVLLLESPWLREFLMAHPEWRQYWACLLIPSPGFTCFTAFATTFRFPSPLGPLVFWVSLGTIHALGWMALWLACRVLPRTWQDRPLAAPKGSWRQQVRQWKYGPPRTRLARRQELLDLNPFLWLTSREPIKDALPWIFLGGMAVLWFWTYLRYPTDVMEQPVLVMGALLLHMVLRLWVGTEAPRQLAADRRTGALELLLSTRVTVPEIIHGQHWALARMFGWPVLVVLAISAFFFLAGLSQCSAQDRSAWLLVWLGGMCMLVADLFTLGWVGVWTGLKARRPSAASSENIIRVWVLPWLVFGLILVAISLVDEFVPAYRGIQRHLEGNTVIGIWFVVSLANNLFHYWWARRLVLRDFRRLAATRPEPPDLLLWLRRLWQRATGSPRNALTLLGVLGLAAGCAHPRVVYRDSTFTGPNLQTGGLAIGAVLARGGGQFERDEDAAQTVRDRLRERHPGLRIEPLGEVKKAFAPAQYSALLTRLDDLTVWTDRDLAPFAGLSNSVRYLLLVEILDTDVGRGQNDTAEWESSSYTDTRGDHYSSDVFAGFRAVKYTTRRTRAMFLVYDLALRRPVWEARGQGTVRVINSDFSRVTRPQASWPGLPDIVSGLDRLAQRVAKKLPR